MYITVEYYRNEYEGITVADDTTLKKLIKRASRQIDTLIGYKLEGLDFNSLAPFILSNLQLAVASQVEYLATNGETSASITEGSDSFSVGNYSESGSGGNTQNTNVVKYASDVRGYLAPTGLLYAGVWVHG